MNIRKGLKAIVATAGLALGALSLTAAPAAATPAFRSGDIFTLENVQLSDGTTLSGSLSFGYYGTVTWNITTQDGLFSGYNYLHNGTAHQTGNYMVVDFARTGYNGYIQIAFTAPLGNADAQIDYANSFECFTYSCTASQDNNKIRHFEAVNGVGAAPFASVPEPGTLSLMGLGLLLVGSMAWFRRRKASDLI